MIGQLARRASLLASAIAWTSAFGVAQQIATPYPLTAPIRDAGIYNLETGRFTPRAQAGVLGAAQINVYDNTCNDAAGFWYGGMDSCEDFFDEGRLPASGPLGAAAHYATNTWSISYCTSTPSGSVDLDWEVFDTTVGGTDSCTLFSAGAPPDFTAGIIGFDSSAAGFPLPGSPTGGLICWLVTFSTSTPICQNAGATASDLFNYRFRMNNANPTGSAQGIVVAGDPTVPPGSNTFNIPPAIDPITGAACGSGLDEQDLWWDNIDNTAVGGIPSCPGGRAFGTNCYWFGGAPTNPFGGFYFRIGAAGSCGEHNIVTTYCTAKVGSNGCVPALAIVGNSLIAVTGSSFISLSNLSEKPASVSHIGQIFWSTVGPNGVPFHGGFLCVKGPGIVRIAPPINYGGTGGASTCNGSLAQNLNASLAANGALAGQTVYVQGWARDTPAFQGIQLSAAFAATIWP